MLFPINGKYRRKQSLSGYWKFKLETEMYLNEAKVKLPLSDYEIMSVPSSYNDIVLDIDKKKHTSLLIYESELFISDCDTHLYFCAITNNASVYLNGEYIGGHIGGYLPFEIALDNVIENDTNRLTIVVDTRISSESLPVGMYTDLTVNHISKEVIKPNFDFFNYTGITRDCYLCEKPNVSIKNITIITKIDGTIEYSVDCVGKKLDAMVKIYDEDNELVAKGSGLEGAVIVDNPRLWEVRDAYLYKFEVILYSDEAEVDSYNLTFGIREVSVKEGNIYVNNKKVYLKGFGKHEDFNVTGRHGSLSDHLYDMNIMKWSNANSFRTSHYPYSEEVMELAKREGFLVIDEVAAVGININFMPVEFKCNKDNLNTFECIKTFDVHKQQLKELIDRDKNNPAVIMWSVANEAGTDEAGAREYFEPLINFVREYDKQDRLIPVVNEIRSTPDDCKISDLIDVLCINRYYGWYINGGELDIAKEKFKNELKQWESKYPDKPIMLTEYGADTIQGMSEFDPVMFTEQYQIEFYKANHEVLDMFSNVCGEQVWNFSDFAVSENIYRVNGNRKGIFTRDRKPKQAAYYLKDRWKNL